MSFSARPLCRAVRFTTPADPDAAVQARPGIALIAATVLVPMVVALSPDDTFTGIDTPIK